MRHFITVAALTIATLTAAAQQTAPRLEIRTSTGQTTFHTGERIPLVLSFTGPEDQRLWLMNLGRADPFRLDSFTITPATGWSDSLAVYAEFNPASCCHQLPNQKLSSKPTTLELNLNEWARFDEPGTYTVTITSNRLSKELFEKFPPERSDLPSNPLQIHIIPATPKWQQATLDRILHDLAVPRNPNSEASPKRRAAIADLRYLDSPAAITVLAAYLRDERYDISEDACLGLVGLPRSLREYALSTLNKLIDDPTFPVSSQFLYVFPWLQMDDPKLPAVETQETRKAADAAQKAAMQPFLEAAWDTIATQLDRKKGKARTATAQTLAPFASLHPSTAAAEEIGATLRSSLPTLSIMDQTNLLSGQWDLLRSPSLLPHLRTLGRPPKAGDDDMKYGLGPMLRAIAIARWYEFEPDDALAEIRRSIGTGTPPFAASDLAFLPKITFPQFESGWAKTLFDHEGYSDSANAGSLLVRFGTGAASAQITGLIAQRSSGGECKAPVEALAYLVKFSPENGRRFFNPGSGAQPSREFTCSLGRFEQIGRLADSPIVLQAALQAMNNPNNQIARDGLRYLKDFGDESVRQPILDRYLEWAEHQPKDAAVPSHDDFLSINGPTNEPHNSEFENISLGNDLALALLANQGWIPDASLIATVRQHCVFKPICERVSTISHADLTVQTPPNAGPMSHIGPFVPATMKLFAAKLAQFPKGTVFTLEHITTNAQTDQDRFEATLPDLFAKHGMTLLTPGQPH